MRHLRRPAALTGLTALLMSGLLAAGNGSAEAAPEDTGQARAQVTSQRTAAAGDSAAAERVRDYWTPKRMRAAEPMRVTATAPGGTVERGAPQVVKGKPVKNDGYIGGRWTGGGNVVQGDKEDQCSRL